MLTEKSTMDSTLPEILAPSLSQEKWWRGNTVPDKAGYQDALILDFYPKNVDVEALQKTIKALYVRHESLRTVFPLINGELKQVIIPSSLFCFELQTYDISTTGHEEQHVFMVQKKMLSFSELQNGPVCKFFLFKISEHLYNISAVVHHIISDAWSIKVLKAELVDIYSRFKSEKHSSFNTPLSQLKEYTELQNIHCSKNRNRDFNYWKKVFANYPSVQLGSHGADIDSSVKYGEFHLPHQALAYVMNFNEAEHIAILSSPLSLQFGLSAVFYTSFLVSFNILNKKDTIIFASPVANRFLNSFQSTIGCLTGGIYLIGQLNKELTVAEVVAGFFTGMVCACRHVIFDHSYLDLDERYLRGNSDLYTNMELNKLGSESPLANDCPSGYQYHPGTYYALECAVSQYQNAFSLRWSCNLRFFEPSFLDALALVVRNVMRYITDHPDDKISCLLHALENIELSDNQVA